MTIPVKIGETFYWPTAEIDEFPFNPRVENSNESRIRMDIAQNGQTNPIRVSHHPHRTSTNRLMIIAGGNTRLRVLRSLGVDDAFCVHWPWRNYLAAIAEHVIENSLSTPLTIADKVLAVGNMRAALSNLDRKASVKHIIQIFDEFGEDESGELAGLKKSSIYIYLHAFEVLAPWQHFRKITRRDIGDSQCRWNQILKWAREECGREMSEEFRKEHVIMPAVSADRAAGGEYGVLSLDRYFGHILRFMAAANGKESLGGGGLVTPQQAASTKRSGKRRRDMGNVNWNLTLTAAAATKVYRAIMDNDGIDEKTKNLFHRLYGAD